MKGLFLSCLKLLDEKIIFPLRFNFLAKELSPHLKECKTVLDLGCSCGRMAKTIEENLKGVSFTGADVNIPPKTHIHVKKIKNDKLPFKSNSFDCVMMIDVLHHCKNPKKIIEEARRVAKKYILIKDHYWENKLDWAYLKFGDYIGNKPYDIALPYNFFNMVEWNKVFKEYKLKIIYQKKFRTCQVGMKDIIFKLKK